jgi:hypothetical protein
MLRICLLFACAATLFPGGASASQIFGDADVVRPTLKVNASGTALVQYTTKAGVQRRVLLWGAINALPSPGGTGEPQRTFRMDYSGGWKSRGDGSYWRTFKNRCRAYDGPALPGLVAACKAPDGSYWALQAWQRNLPMRGFAPWTERQRAVELHASHWSGPLPQLEIHRRWTYAQAQQGFFGRLLYQGEPVFGTRTPSASVRDAFARNIYISAFDSDYGPGWKHDTAIVTHPGNGGFCYTFVPQAPPAGYPSTKPNGNGLGERYAVTVMGPGVTPVIRWEGPRLTRLDPVAQAAATKTFDEILGADRHCAPER